MLGTPVPTVTSKHKPEHARVTVSPPAWGSSFQIQLQAKVPAKEPSLGLALGASQTPQLIQDSYSSLLLLSTSSSFQPLEFFPNLYTSRRPSTLSRISRL